MSLFVKICGITDAKSAENAASAGADAIGFVFAPSPRQVSPDLASRISTALHPDILRVAVFRRPTREMLERVLASFTPDVIQADHDVLGGVAGVGRLPVYREGSGAAPEGGRFLYEGPRSGVGVGVDLPGAASMARLGEMVLAGGLRPDNVARAVMVVRPFGVDVSSGVESAPGVKEPSLVRAFVSTVRAAEERLVNA